MLQKTFLDSFLGTTMSTITIIVMVFYGFHGFLLLMHLKMEVDKKFSSVLFFFLLVEHSKFLPIWGSRTVWKAEPVLNLFL